MKCSPHFSLLPAGIWGDSSQGGDPGAVDMGRGGRGAHLRGWEGHGHAAGSMRSNCVMGIWDAANFQIHYYLTPQPPSQKPRPVEWGLSSPGGCLPAAAAGAVRIR
jgi:hypothetical protein